MYLKQGEIITCGLGLSFLLPVMSSLIQPFGSLKLLKFYFISSCSHNLFRAFAILLLLTNLQFCVRVQLSLSERKQWLQYNPLSQGAVRISRTCRLVKREQQATSDHQSLWKDVRPLIERFTNTTGIVIQQPAVKLGSRRVEIRGR